MDRDSPKQFSLEVEFSLKTVDEVGGGVSYALEGSLSHSLPDYSVSQKA